MKSRKTPSTKSPAPKARENRYKKRAKQSGFRAGRGLWTVFWILAGMAAIIAMSLVFVFGYDWAVQSDYFRADTVEINGNHRLSERQIMETTGIRPGVNTLSVNLGTARRRLMAEAWVADAEIRRQFPDTMRIVIREHEPAAVIDLGRRFLINETAEIFREAAENEFPGLPLITGVGYRDWRNALEEKTRAVSSVVALLELHRKKQKIFAGHVLEQIRVDRDLGLVVHAGRLPVDELQLGYGKYDIKLKRLKKVLSYLERHQPSLRLEKMDLRNPDRIVARPAAEQQSVATGQKEA